VAGPAAPGRARGRSEDLPPPLPSTLSVRQQARRQRVVEAGRELLATRDYDRIQVKDVADQGGVALGTLYRYFSSKEHLFAEVIVAWASSLETHISRHPVRGETPAERLADTMRRSVRAFQKQPQMARLITTLTMSTDPFAAEVLGRLDQATRTVYRQALQPLPDDQARIIVDVVDSVLTVGLREWTVGRASIVSVYDRIDEAIDLLIGGAPGGTKR
jgi:AcrR family transcriptional regulator